MAVRLSVLILKPSPEFQGRFENIVGELLGRPGLDVVMLERIPAADEGATESLALEGLSPPIACLTWHEFDKVQHDLAAAGYPLSRCRHADDPAGESSNANQAAAYFFDLRPASVHDSILDKLRTLRDRLNVTTFSLQGLAPPPRKPVVAQADVSPKRDAESNDVTHNNVTKADSTASPQPSPERSLEQLVDELDELDL